jgi:hypothetical protein
MTQNVMQLLGVTRLGEESRQAFKQNVRFTH